jgi:biopolymer transport protein ExbD
MSPESHLSDPQINATPLIDILLVLLVVLIFTLPIATHAVKLELPNGDGKPQPRAVQLEILFRGELYWNGEYIASVDELTPKFAAIAGQANPPLLRVIPEKRAPYERVAQVLAAAQRQHIQRMSVQPVADN